MRPEQWEAATALFEQAITLPPNARAEFVAASCGDDEALRDELLSLLAAFDQAPEWFAALEEKVAAPARAVIRRDAAPATEEASRPGERSGARTRLGHYDRLERLGSGGMGVVYRARDTRLDRQVALKFVAPERVADADSLRRLVREARAASALDHPSICTIYGIEEAADGELCIVMAYCGAGTLKDRLVEGALSVRDALSVGTQLAAGLAHAHSSGLVHRDLKPGNIGFSEDGQAKLLDFGLSVRRTGSADSDASRIAGTIAYMAPEQLRGEPADPRADVWSLGVTLFEMIVGQRPFGGPDDAATMFSVLEHEPPRLDTLRNDLPPRLADLVAAMLRKPRDERPADGAAVLGAIVQLAESIAPHGAAALVAAPPAPTPPRRRAMARRTRTILALFGLLAVSALAWRVWSSDTAAPSAVPDDAGAAGGEERLAVAVLPFAIRGGEELAYLREGMVDLLATTLDGVGGLRGIDPNAVLGVAARESGALDPARARAVAARLGARRYVLGTIVQLGAGMQLTAALYDSSGAERARARTVIVAESALVRGVDDLARQLVASELTTPAEQLAGLAAMTTHSLPALRAYLDGERLLRDARPEAALARFADAVERDSMFALAWYRLARAAGWRQMDSINTIATERARRHADALPPRVRRIVDAYHHLRAGDPREAERRLRVIVTEHPDDAETWLLLGEALFHNNPGSGRSASEAREPLRRAMLLDPRNREVTVHLMDLAARHRQLGQLDTLFRMYFSPNSEGEQPGIRQAYTTLHARLTGDRSAAESALQRLEEAGAEAVAVALARVAPQIGDFDLSTRLAEHLASPGNDPATRAHGLVNVALFELARGRWTRAERAWRDAAVLDPGLAVMYRALAYAMPMAPVPPDSLRAVRALLAAWSVREHRLDRSLTDPEQEVARLYLIGLLSTRLGDAAGAADVRRRLLSAGTDSSSRHLAAALAGALLGHAALRRGQSGSALVALQEGMIHWPFARRAGSPVLEQHLERLAYADALLAEGRDRDALSWYAALHDGYHHLGSPLLGVTLTRRAAIFERLGRPADARLLYAQFIDLWQDADPALQSRIAAVRDRLETLQQ